MNPRVIRIIILAMFSAMTGLVGIQIIWIRSAVEQREEQFNQEVYAALAHVSERYEKELWARSIEKMLDWTYLETGVQFMIDSINQAVVCKPMDSLQKVPRAHENNYYINFQLNPSRAGRGPSGPFARDEYYPPPQADAGYIESLDQTYRFLTESRNIIGNMLKNLVSNFMFTENQAPDSALLGEIIRDEFEIRGLKFPFEFAVRNTFSDRAEIGDMHKEMQESPYRILLGSDPIFAQYELILHFPQKNRFLLSNIFFLLVASAVLIIIIIGSFAYTISVIFRQKHIQEIKNDLINNITHELKTPISTISLAVQAMSDPAMGEIQALREKYLQIIKDENQRLGQLVENVLQTAVFDRGEFTLKIKKTDLHQKIEKVVASLSMQAQSKNIRINKNLHADPYYAEVDEVMITNLIYNLVDNGIKYSSGKDPHINLSTWNEDGYFCLEVADNGIGISKDDQKRIFDKLYRVPTGNVHNVKGYGLGLSYVKSIVERHGGQINVKSALGEGSRFTVKLPLKQPRHS